MEPELSKEEMKAIKESYRQAQKAHMDAINQARKIRRGAFSKLRQTRDEEDAAIESAYNEAVAPTQKLFEAARERSDKAYAQVDRNRAYIDKVDRFVLVLSSITMGLSCGIYIFILRMLNVPGTYAEIILNPIPVIITLGLYVAWLTWLNRLSRVQILRGPLFPTNMEVGG